VHDRADREAGGGVLDRLGDVVAEDLGPGASGAASTEVSDWQGTPPPAVKSVCGELPSSIRAAVPRQEKPGSADAVAGAMKAVARRARRRRLST
jgi:hypothetical protein